MARLLVIDDSRLILHAAKKILVEAGHEVITARDGTSGIDAAVNGMPDLILLDLVMPGIDGYEVCRRLKQDERTMDIPVIMLTSKADPKDKVKGLKAGAVDYVAKPFDGEELIARVNIHLKIRELVNALEEKNRQLQELANRDGLTGLYNHRFFQEKLSLDFKRAERYEEKLCCIIIDVDFFKRFNDEYGHQVGDMVLKNLARIFHESIRESDLVARYGGEEFGIVLYATDESLAFEIAERIRRKVEEHQIAYKDKALRITISAGVSCYPGCPAKSPGELLEAADQALYLAKQKGRNRVEKATRN